MSNHVPDAVRPVSSPATPTSGARKRRLSETDLASNPFSPYAKTPSRKTTTPRATSPTRPQSQASPVNGTSTRKASDESASPIELANSAADKSLDEDRSISCHIFNQIIQLFCSARPSLHVFEPITSVSNHAAWPSKYILDHYTWFGIPICLNNDWALVTLNRNKKKVAIVDVSGLQKQARTIAQDFLRSVEDPDELAQWGFEIPVINTPIKSYDHAVFYLVKAVYMVVSSKGRQKNSACFFRRLFAHIVQVDTPHESAPTSPVQELDGDERYMDGTFHFAPGPTARSSMSDFLNHVKGCIENAYRISSQLMDNALAETKGCIELNQSLEASFTESRITKARAIYTDRQETFEKEIAALEDMIERIANFNIRLDTAIEGMGKDLEAMKQLLKLNQDRLDWLDRMEKALPHIKEFVNNERAKGERRLRRLDQVADEAEGGLREVSRELQSSRRTISHGAWTRDRD